jgi:hypothetical protein
LAKVLDEQKAILIIDGNHSEVEAERLICTSENFRRTVTGNFLQDMF